MFFLGVWLFVHQAPAAILFISLWTIVMWLLGLPSTV